MAPLMLDIFAGLGGASSAMRRRGWGVVTLDIDERFEPDICASVVDWHWAGARPDLFWCSPPCTAYSRLDKPWFKSDPPPDTTLWRESLRLVSEIRPRWWIIENVRGAQKFHGQARFHAGPFYLWGRFPDLGDLRALRIWKNMRLVKSPPERAKVPYVLSLVVALAIERQQVMQPFVTEFP